MSGGMIKVERLAKWYGAIIGVNDINLELGPGVHGLLGPNGAGKTTFLRIVAGQLRPSTGRVEVLGQSPWNRPDVLARIGLCPEADAFWDELTGLEFVHVLLRFSGYSDSESTDRAKKALALFELADVMDRPVSTYSRGMKQRTKLAQAFAHDPEVLILDEPLAGTDPLTRATIVDAIRSRGEKGACVIVSSHVLHEVESMTEDVLLLVKGQLVADGNMYRIRELIDEHPHHILVECDRPRELGHALLDAPSVLSLRFPAEDAVEVETKLPDACYDEIPRRALEKGIKVKRLTSPDASLEAVFKYLVEGKHTRERVEKPAPGKASTAPPGEDSGGPGAGASLGERSPHSNGVRS
jgi:ABC-2 type transport system ATP-binding protein